MVDLCRFIAAVMIMLCHLDLVGTDTYPTYMFVDFFFILSGYFTVAHFARQKYISSPDKRGRIALIYTAKKFVPFLPHLLVALPIVYASSNYHYLASGDFGGFITGFGDMFAELLLLPIKFFSNDYRLIGPLWYLSALLFAMPLFSYICQSKYRRPIGYIGLIFAYIYFSMQDCISAFDPVSALCICASCMFIGMFVYDVVLEIKDKKISNKTRLFVTAVELVCLAYCIIAAVSWNMPVKMQVIAYIAMLIVMLSGASYTAKLKVPFFSWLGKISMPLFIWHYVVGRILLHFVPIWSTRRLTILFFVCSFAVAIAAHYSANFIMRRLSRKHEKTTS